MYKKILLIVLISLTFVFACSDGVKTDGEIKDIKNNGVFAQNITIDEIDSLVLCNKYTIIYCWGVWCKPCLSHLQNEISSYLDAKTNDSIAFLPICIGGSEDKVLSVLHSINFKYGSYIFSSKNTALDKYIINNKFNKLFNSYKKVDYVPFVVLLNNNKDVLNYNIKEKRYYSLSETLEMLNNI
ncbi:MAG: thioredoxin family protein [Bacteroidales bacterium]|jgi:hypothetical protein|nr:thioredoxin family protein [Bacteroidales bacterium]